MTKTLLTSKELTTIRQLLLGIIASAKEIDMIKSVNPQVVSLKVKAKAERELAAAVLSALHGDTALLRTYASEGTLS